MIGKGDLRLNLGLPKFGGGETSYEESMNRIFALAAKYNMPLVGYTPENETEACIRGGYRMICPVADFYALGFGVAMGLAESRGVVAKVTESMKAAYN